jgi:hypothetical protein
LRADPPRPLTVAASIRKGFAWSLPRRAELSRARPPESITSVYPVRQTVASTTTSQEPTDDEGDLDAQQSAKPPTDVLFNLEQVAIS